MDSFERGPNERLRDSPTASSGEARWPVSRSTPKRWLRIALFFLVPYVVCVMTLAFFQRALIYHPTRVTCVDPRDAGFPRGQVHPLCLKTADGLVLHGWHVLANGRRAAGRMECDEELVSGQHLILYFPGNAGHRGYRGSEMEILTSAGANVWLFDYRGYGENAGSPGEERLAADARQIWDYATGERKVPPERVILYGESLGGGVAVRLAAELSSQGTAPGGIVLRSTFSSLADAGAHHYPWLPVRWLLRDAFPASDQIGKVACPILQLHGTDDWIVPIRLGRRLFDAAPARSASGIPKRFFELAGAGHNDVVDVARGPLRGAVIEFLDRLARSSKD